MKKWYLIFCPVLTASCCFGQANVFPADGNVGIGTVSPIKKLDTGNTAIGQTALEGNTTGTGSNSVVLSNSSVTKTLLQGNVGVGTSDPQSKLAINGTVTAKQVKVTQTRWPDYVFDSAYKLVQSDKNQELKEALESLKMEFKRFKNSSE